MSEHPFDRMPPPEFDEPLTNDEGGLRAPPHLTGWRKAWWWFDFIILVKLARLRFIAVLVVIGAVITQWDTLAAYYDRWTRPGVATAQVAGDVEWFCPMHPAVVRDNSKEKCPICFMPLSKRKKGDVHADALPPGVVNRVQLSPYRQVLAGVQTWEVSFQPLVKQITAVGYVEFNERGRRNVSARVKGRIDQLFVSETGQMVSAGDVLASLYSPELNVTVQNLVSAKQAGNAELLRSARVRLQLLGISDDQIDDILSTGKANTHLKIRTPISGHVIKKYVREGDYVEEGTPLYDVADLSSVWILAQVYEKDLAFLPLDQSHKPTPGAAESLVIAATTDALPDEVFRGTLAFVYPHVDQATRTATVRFEIANPGHRLRPGSTANVVLDVPAKNVQAIVKAVADDPARREKLAQGLVLAVPETAVIDTGSQRIVYRQSSPGVFEGVEVRLGPKMTGPEGVTFYPVLGGLASGERIVTSGSFLVDAETRLNPAAGSIYFGGSGGSKSSTGSTVRPSTPEDTDAKIDANLAKLSDDDRALARKQKTCPVLTGSRLGTMGVPSKLSVDGRTVFVCCDACKAQALAEPQKTLAIVDGIGASPNGQPNDEASDKIRAALAKLSAADRAAAEAQRTCAVMSGSKLGSMGPPVKLTIEGQPVFLCCEHCRDRALADPKQTLSKVQKLKQSANKSDKQ
jgi:multidrug efflux pump subunit AcrA (membrane-fusion protein)